MFQRVFRLGQVQWDEPGESFLRSTTAPLSAPSPPPPARGVWQQIIDRRLDTALVLLPHAAPHPDFVRLLDHYWPAVPTDWDVVCLGGYYPTPPTHVAAHVMRPSELMQVHGYAVRPRICAELLRQEESSPIERLLTTLARGAEFNIYALWPNLICPAGDNDYFESFRELGQYGQSRLGNQLFQVAATLGAASRHGYRPQFPVWENSKLFREHFDQKLDESRILSRYIEKEFHYVEIPHPPNLDIVGFFQSPRYFAGFENLIRHYLRPRADCESEVTAKRAALGPRPTVAIHVRHGDYLSMPERFRVLPLEYYRAAMSIFDESHQFAVFSDDPAWCRQVFAADNVQIVTGNSDIVDLYLMASCQHQIIANSSFSWWGAWLNTDPCKRVIAPKPWFGPALGRHDTGDLLPGDWATLEH